MQKWTCPREWHRSTWYALAVGQQYCPAGNLLLLLLFMSGCVIFVGRKEKNSIYSLFSVGRSCISWSASANDGSVLITCTVSDSCAERTLALPRGNLVKFLWTVLEYPPYSQDVSSCFLHRKKRWRAPFLLGKCSHLQCSKLVPILTKGLLWARYSSLGETVGQVFG